MKDRKSLRVLVVEDEATINELICNRVRELGHEVIGRAFDEPQAVQLARELCPDVVLLDLRMTDPRTGHDDRDAGLNAARAIQEQRPTPIVVLTAHEAPELLQRASEVGAGAYLLKPPDTPELERSITIAVARFNDLQEVRRLNAELEEEIAERRRVENALRRSEMILSEAERIAHLGSWEWDIANDEFTMSEEWQRIHGYDKARLSRDELLPIAHPNDLPAIEQALQNMMEAGAPYDIEHRIIRQDNGEPRFVRAYGEVVRDDAGQIIKAYGATQDITERKRLEEERECYAEDLQRSNDDLQQFAYIVSHDLKEPLRMVKSYLGLLERRYKDKLDESANDFIFFAVDGAERMEKLIKGLLDYSRVGTRGKEPAPVDCEQVLRNALMNLRFRIEDCNATVTHDPLPMICADATQLNQLFQNLIGNALKFCDEKPPRIHISANPVSPFPSSPQRGEGEESSLSGSTPSGRLRAGAGGEGEWLFAVCDNGIGIAEKDYDRVFGVFQRLHGRDKYEGTGIGLAICKKIVTRHSGRIWVESEVGKGTTFYFTLPECAENEDVA